MNKFVPFLLSALAATVGFWIYGKVSKYLP